jgi:hypothetical protein
MRISPDGSYYVLVKDGQGRLVRGAGGTKL